MRYSVVAGALMAIGALAQAGGASSWPKNADLTGQICVERVGDQGVLDLQISNVMIAGGPTLALRGEQAACAYVRPGDYHVWAQSSNPYNPLPTDKNWTSETLNVSVAANARANLEVCGTGGDAGYSNWKIQRPAPECK